MSADSNFSIILWITRQWNETSYMRNITNWTLLQKYTLLLNQPTAQTQHWLGVCSAEIKGCRLPKETERRDSKFFLRVLVETGSDLTENRHKLHCSKTERNKWESPRFNRRYRCTDAHTVARPLNIQAWDRSFRTKWKRRLHTWSCKGRTTAWFVRRMSPSVPVFRLFPLMLLCSLTLSRRSSKRRTKTRDSNAARGS